MIIESFSQGGSEHPRGVWNNFSTAKVKRVKELCREHELVLSVKMSGTPLGIHLTHKYTLTAKARTKASMYFTI